MSYISACPSCIEHLKRIEELEAEVKGCAEMEEKLAEARAEAARLQGDHRLQVVLTRDQRERAEQDEAKLRVVTEALRDIQSICADAPNIDRNRVWEIAHAALAVALEKP